MVGGSIVLGITMISLAVYLHLQYGGPEQGPDTEKAFLSRRRSVRSWVHGLMFACGVLMLLSTFTNPGVAWAGIWTGIVGLLFVIILLAMFDAINSHRQHTKQLQAIQKEYLRPVEHDDA